MSRKQHNRLETLQMEDDDDEDDDDDGNDGDSGNDDYHTRAANKYTDKTAQ